MADEIFKRSVWIARPAAEVFDWHEGPGAFTRLGPPWERVEMTRHVGGICDGALVSLRTKVGPVWATWRGAFNAVAPAPVTNAEFTATLARVLRRPAILPVPDRATQAGFVWRPDTRRPAMPWCRCRFWASRCWTTWR